MTQSQSRFAAAELAQTSGGKYSTGQDAGEKLVTWEEIIKEAKRHFSGTQFFLAQVEGQHANGKVEANNILIKRWIRSLIGLLRKQSLGLFESILSI